PSTLAEPLGFTLVGDDSADKPAGDHERPHPFSREAAGEVAVAGGSAHPWEPAKTGVGELDHLVHPVPQGEPERPPRITRIHGRGVWQAAPAMATPDAGQGRGDERRQCSDEPATVACVDARLPDPGELLERH